MKQKDLEDVCGKIGSEGFDYAFRCYSDFSQVKDVKFHQLRKAYTQAASDLEEYLGCAANKYNLDYDELIGC